MNKKTILLLVLVTMLSSNAFTMNRRQEAKPGVTLSRKEKRFLKKRFLKKRFLKKLIRRKASKRRKSTLRLCTRKKAELEAGMSELKDGERECKREIARLHSLKLELTTENYNQSLKLVSLYKNNNKGTPENLQQAVALLQKARGYIRNLNATKQKLGNIKNRMREIKKELQGDHKMTMGEFKQEQAQKRHRNENLPEIMRKLRTQERKNSRITAETKAILDTLENNTTCKYCTKWGNNLLVCSGCKKARYCSEGCQKKDWKRRHKSECLV